MEYLFYFYDWALAFLLDIIWNLIYFNNINIRDMLQTQELRVVQEEEPCIWVNTRKLNRELCTELSTFYTKLQ